MAEMVKAKLNGQFEIVLPKHRADRPEWYTDKGWEKARLDSMHKNTNPGDKVYYVGAEEGEMCVLLRMWGANLLMFEPNEKVLPNIKAIYDANNLPYDDFIVGFAGKNATAKPKWEEAARALANVKGEVIGDHGFKELNDPGGIPIYRIDDCVTAGFISPTMITMDVEGSEWEVLQGAEETIKRYKPLIYLSLHPEFLFRIYGKYSYEVRRWIMDMGYEEKLLDYQHEVHLVYYPKGTTLNE